MKKIILFFTGIFLSIALCANAAILCETVNGTATVSSLSFADALASPTCNSIILTTIQSVINDTTVSKTIKFDPIGGGLNISSGKVVTFQANPIIPMKHVFFGLGTVAGIPVWHTIWFGTVGDGVTDDTAALEKAGKSLGANETLEFDGNDTHLISYIWTPLTDSDSVNGIGRGRAVIYERNLSGITIHGNGSTIKCVNHDIATNGGFTFIWTHNTPKIHISGFNFDMSFTGYNNSSSYYPMNGGIIVVGYGTDATAMPSDSSFTDMTFKLYHPHGAFATTSHPYGSDNNNGYKVLSVFVGCATNATYDQQAKNITIENIHFLAGHNCYGTWGYGYSNAVFKNIYADAWVASHYTIDTDSNDGTGFTAPVRFNQYYATGLDISNIKVKSLPWASRTGAFTGVAYAIQADSDAPDSTTGGANISNVDFVGDAASTGAPANFDAAVSVSLAGHTNITNVNADGWSTHTGIFCISMQGQDSALGEASYTITNSSSSKKVNDAFLRLVNYSSTAAANRTIKRVAVNNCNIMGFGAAGAIWVYDNGNYSGIESLTVNDTHINGAYSYSPLQAVLFDTGVTTDSLIMHHNIIKNAYSMYQCGHANVVADNNFSDGTNSHTVNNYVNDYWRFSGYTASQEVSISMAANELYEYYYVEYSSTNTMVTTLAGIANSGAGTLRTVATGNTGKLLYHKVMIMN